MRVVILHPPIPHNASLEDQDTMVQVEAISGALGQLGHEVTALSCTLDLAAVRDELVRLPPDVVFNLVESVDGADSLQHFLPALLDALHLPYTGAPAEAIFQTTHKLLAKQILHLAGLPTPAWQIPGGRPSAICNSEVSMAHLQSCPWIVKAVWEHASQGLDEHSIIPPGNESLLQARLRAHAAQTGRPCFAEQFIEGREFSIAFLDGPDGPEFLPGSEIDFSAFPPEKPRIVGYRAKWETDSFEFHHTPRCFDVSASDQPLLEELRRLARACWDLFGLRGYARVDFRVDRQDRPWILEINTNPCLSPDAGFAAGLEHAAIPFEKAVARILEATLPRDLAR